MKPYLCGFDTEDDSAAHPYLFCFVHERGQSVSETRGPALEFLLRLRDRVSPRPLECWAVNLEYDAVNLWGERIRECRLQFGRHALFGVEWRGIKFRDTVRHLPVSARELGGLVGLPKLTRDTSRAYCLRDAAIAYRTGRFLNRAYARLGERPRLTLPSTVYAVWSRQYFKDPVLAPAWEVRRHAREAYYGGRTEAFAVGEFDAPSSIDVASMYPWAMTAGPFPVPWESFTRVGKGARIEPLGLYRVRVSSDVYPGVLPVRTDRGLEFPIGTWGGWYVGEELIAAVENGAKIRVEQGYTWERTVKPFDRYVRNLFAAKRQARGPLRLLYKLMLNALYGKFGQSGERCRALALKSFLKLKRPPEAFRVWQGLALWREESTPPPWANYLWAAIVTARARIRLREMMRQVDRTGGRVLYVDTDSILLDGISLEGIPGVRTQALRPGEWERRGVYRRATIIGKKEYMVERQDGSWEFLCKGIPEAERKNYLLTGEASFKLPFKIRAASRAGQPANLWRTVTKRRMTRLDRLRGVRPDRTLRPLRVSG